MEISNLAFIVTDDCNYNCSYCPQKKEKKTISLETIETTVDFFYPFIKSSDKILIGFYGGEPLLAFDKIKTAVLLLEEKNRPKNKHLEFTLTTNGSVLTDEMSAFFNEHRFALQLSFDGLAQEKARKKGTLPRMLRVMKQIQAYPGITFEINSVFSPQTVDVMYESLRYIIEQGGPDITFNLASTERWEPSHFEILQKEMERLADYMALYYKKNGDIPLLNFRSSNVKPGISRCGAGLDHIAVTPEGKVWGCFLFHDYFKTREDDPRYRDYSFGMLEDFIVNYETRYPAIMANYSELRQDFYRTDEKDCFLCPELDTCRVCPVNAAYNTGSIGKISCQKCRLLKIEKDAREAFVNAFGDQGAFLKNRPLDPRKTFDIKAG